MGLEPGAASLSTVSTADEPLVEDIYAKAIAKENTCLQIEEKEDFFTQMHLQHRLQGFI